MRLGDELLIHTSVTSAGHSPIENKDLKILALFPHIDDFSRNVWLFTLKFNRECFEKFKEFKSLVKMKLKHKIKAFQLDNSREFVSKAFYKFLKDHDIGKQMPTIYTPQQNRVAERVNRTIVKMARNTFHAQNLDKQYWAKVVADVVYIRK